VKWLPLLALVVVVVLYLGGRDTTREDDQREREVIHTADTVYVQRADTLKATRTRTDTLLQFITDTVVRAQVDTIIQHERNACDAVISACEQRVKARDARIATLEKRSAGWLFLYGEAGGGLRNGSIPVLEGEVGAAVLLDRSTSVQLGVDTDRDIKLKVRRQIKLF
jgi:hypothetical protein